MKKYILNVLFSVMVFAPLLGVADVRSQQIIDRLSGIIKGYKNYEVSFSATLDQSKTPMVGRYVVAGERYFIDAHDRQIYSDGVNKYEANSTQKEVVIDRINASKGDMMSNPVHAFEFVNEGFSHTFKGEITFRGKKCLLVVLKATSSKAALQEIDLMVDAVSGLPVGVRYRFEGLDNEVEVQVTKIAKLATVDNALFVYSKARHKGFEIIDFR